MKQFATLFSLFWLAAASAAIAQTRPVVVELYTSQGCSSCPPADAYFLDKLSKRDDVIALALHVDYWDYIGWKDNFGNSTNTKRQKDYARAAGHRSVYTPQMIIGGRDHVVGNHPYEVMDLIKAHQKSTSPVSIQMERKGGSVIIKAQSTKSVGPMLVQLVRYIPEESVEIKRGENAGKTLKYANIVEDWDVLAEWDGKKPLRIRAPARGKMPVVVLIQSVENGPIWAAARLR